jgi:hypothetical protein
MQKQLNILSALVVLMLCVLIIDIVAQSYKPIRSLTHFEVEIGDTEEYDDSTLIILHYGEHVATIHTDYAHGVDSVLYQSAFKQNTYHGKR